MTVAFLTFHSETSRINEKNQKEIVNLAQRIEEIDRENWSLRKDKDRQKILIDKQQKKIRELGEIIDKYKQLKYIGHEYQDELGNNIHIF